MSAKMPAPMMAPIPMAAMLNGPGPWTACGLGLLRRDDLDDRFARPQLVEIHWEPMAGSRILGISGIIGSIGKRVASTGIAPICEASYIAT
jgi:hypothetical protein